MARLRNRIVKAEFWTDGELLRWPRDKRGTYRGLWALAEDSGCIEDDPFTWKLTLWPSPIDADITVELITTWRDELIAADKLRSYTADGKQYLYLTRFHQHEHPRNPQRNDLPLPPWVVWEPNASDPRKGQYRGTGDVVAPLYNELTSVPVLPCPVLSCPVLPEETRSRAKRPPLETTKTEQETLDILTSIPGFPDVTETDLALLREPRDPRVDLAAEARGYRDWVADQRDRGKKTLNFRSSWRNRLANAVRFCKERNGPLPASHAPFKDMGPRDGDVPPTPEFLVSMGKIGRSMA